MHALLRQSWLAALVAAMGTPVLAEAASARTSSLAWVRSEGAETCIGGKELAESVERVLGRRVFVSASAADVAIEGRVSRNDGPSRWKVMLRLSDEHGALLGSREIESDAADCREMDASVSFVIAVMIDPDAAERPRPPLPDAASAPAPSPRESTSAAEKWQLVPQLGFTVAIGELPSASVGPTARVRVGPPRIGLELGGSVLLPADADVPNTATATVRFTWAYATAAVCPRIARLKAVSLLGCAGALGGVVTATPKGLDAAQESSDFSVLATLHGRVEWSVTSRLFLSVDAGAEIPFNRARWTVTTAGGATPTVFRPAVLAFEGGLAVGLALD